MPSPALPGLFFAFAAMVLLLFASVSPPVWNKVTFLNATVGTTKTVFGVFGECVVGGSCSHRSVGYHLTVNGANDLNAGGGVLHNLTYTLILHPIAGLCALIALICGLLGNFLASRVATVFMALWALIGFVFALVVFVIDMVLWNVVKQRIHSAGYAASLGNANWFTIGAVASLFLCFCVSLCGSFGRFASGRMAGEKY